MKTPDKKRQKMEFIIDSVCKTLDLPYSEVVGKSRKNEKIDARYIAMYLIKKKVTKTSLKSIAAPFGKSHCSVLHALKMVKKWSKINYFFREKKNLCIEALETEYPLHESAIYNHIPQF